MGIKDSAGFSSNADEIKVAYAHFEGTVVEPKRKKIASGFGYMLRLAGYNVSLKIRPNKLVNEEEVTNVQPQENIETL